MKKIVSRVLMLALVSSLVLGLAACGDKKEDEKPVVDTPVVEVEPEVEVEEEKEPVVVAIDEIAKTLKATYGDAYLPAMELDAETFNMTLGIEADKASEVYSEFYGAVAPMSTHVDKLFVVKTADVEGAKKVFADYMAKQVEDAMQYPMNLVKLENHVIYEYQDYVILAILGGYTDEVAETTDEMTPEEVEKAEAELQKKFYEEQNEKGKAALDDLFENGYTATEEETETESEATETEEGAVEGAVEGAAEAVVEAGKAAAEVAGEVASEVIEETTEETEATEAPVEETEVPAEEVPAETESGLVNADEPKAE